MDAGRSLAPPALECSRLVVAYHESHVLDGIDLRLAAGESVALLGPSGSGKTTLLYAVAGFIDPAAGEIRIGGQPVAGPALSVPPERRDVGLVFQHYALWPHLSALETVAYPMRRRGVGGSAARAQALQLLERLGIGHLAGRRPTELSGGEQQRVGLARALARKAGLYLFDEPTAHLDTPLRAALQEELVVQRRAVGAAALHATHDVSEALAVADRVALLGAGRIIQVGTPRSVYEEPLDLRAARLTGPASLLEATVVSVAGGTVRFAPLRPWEGPARPDGRELCVPGRAAGNVVPSAGRVLVRPDWVTLEGDLPGTVADVWYRGSHTDVALDTPLGRILARVPGPPPAGRGVAVGWRVDRAWVVPADR